MYYNIVPFVGFCIKKSLCEVKNKFATCLFLRIGSKLSDETADLRNLLWLLC